MTKKFEAQKQVLQASILKAISEFFANVDLDTTGEEDEVHLEVHVNGMSDEKFADFLQLNEEVLGHIRSSPRNKAVGFVHEIVGTAQSEANLRQKIRIAKKVRGVP